MANLLSIDDRIVMDRMWNAMETVRQRLNRTVTAFEDASIPYAVVGGHAVANWVSTIDEGATRATRDVDLLIARQSLPDAIQAMERAGFHYAQTSGVDLFVDGPTGKPSTGVHLLFAGENVRPTDPCPTPVLSESVRGPEFQVVTLEALVRMKLVSYRTKDRTHIVDLMHVGLIDDTWPARFVAPLNERLLDILNDPNEKRNY